MPMKTSSAERGLSRVKARNCALINQLATPGLGSLMAGRYLVGTGQLLLAVGGAGFVIGWFVAVMAQTVQQLDGDAPPKSVAWLGEIGALLFAISWLWALVTSLSLLRHAQPEETRVPPKIH